MTRIDKQRVSELVDLERESEEQVIEPLLFLLSAALEKSLLEINQNSKLQLWDRVSRQAHSLKVSFNNLGLCSLAGMMLKVEHDAKFAIGESIVGYIASVRIGYQRDIRMLRNEATKLHARSPSKSVLS